jgi:hypothetical protein
LRNLDADSRYFQKCESTANLALFLCALGLSGFAAVMAIEKGPLVWILFGLLLAWLLVRKGGIITMRRILPFMMLALLLMALIYMALEGSASLASGLLAVFRELSPAAYSRPITTLHFFPPSTTSCTAVAFPTWAGCFPGSPTT